MLLKIHSDIIHNIDQQKITALVLLDLSAAFDSISQSKLLDILNCRFNISGNSLNWFKTYLLNRTRIVSIDNSYSSSTKLNYGVPQGSCIGPIAFLAYISAIQEIVLRHNITIEAFADDTQLYLSCNNNPKSLNHTLYQIEQCVSDIRTFFLTHQLKINDNKTEQLLIGSPIQISKISINEISIRVGNSTIPVSHDARNLGVNFDSTLSFKQHFKNVSRKSYFQLTKINQIKKYLPADTIKSLIHSLIFSNLDYCNALYYNLPQTQLNKLQKIQNSAARIISGTPKYNHITPVLKSLHWLPVKVRIEFKILILTFKALYSDSSSPVQDMVSKYNPPRSLRSANKNKLCTPKIKNEVGSRSFRHASPTLWNSLPYNIRSISSLPIFKSRLKTYLFCKYFN